MNDEQEEEQKKHLFYVLFNLTLPTTKWTVHWIRKEGDGFGENYIV